MVQFECLVGISHLLAIMLRHHLPDDIPVHVSLFCYLIINLIIKLALYLDPPPDFVLLVITLALD